MNNNMCLHAGVLRHSCGLACIHQHIHVVVSITQRARHEWLWFKGVRGWPVPPSGFVVWCGVQEAGLWILELHITSTGRNQQAPCLNLPLNWLYG